MPTSSTFERLKIEAIILDDIASGRWGSKRAQALSLRFHCHVATIYRHRSRALKRFRRLSGEDLDAERGLILRRLDDITQAALDLHKPQAAVQALRLRADLLGLKGRPIAERSDGDVRRQTVGELLEQIARAQAIAGELDDFRHEDDDGEE